MKKGWLARPGIALAAITGALFGEGKAQAIGPSTGGAATIAQAERMLGHTKRVLMVGAHPDDEDTELLTYLVRHEGAVAAYLSLTRGEGGQNLIGPELGEALGLIRSEELLAARGLDGARQFFTRAYDFGFSKTLTETLSFWPKDSLLKDVVRVVRRFRPQIIVSIFSGTPRDGHGQHQAAGWAANEVFAAAGDPNRFPELLTEERLEPWQPLKLFRSAQFDTAGGSVVLDGGQLDPVVGQSYHQIAMRSRSLHRSQDMGVLQEIGPSPIRLALLADRTGAGSVMFAGVDTMPPSGGVEAADLEPIRATKLLAEQGVVVDAIADRGRIVAGQRVTLRLSLWNSGSTVVGGTAQLRVPAGWLLKSDCLGRPHQVGAGAVVHCSAEVWPDQAARPTVPYFLDLPRVGAMYQWVGDPAVRGEPFQAPLLVAQFEVRGPGGTASVERAVVYRFRDQALGEQRQPLVVAPRVGLRLAPANAVWPTRGQAVEPIVVTVVHAGADPTTGTVRLLLPPGWPSVPPQPFRLSRPDERRTLSFSVRRPATLASGVYRIVAVATDHAGRRYDVGQASVVYPHIREQVYPAPAVMEVAAASIALPPKRRIGYVRGAADRVPEALAGLGLPVEVLDRSAIERGDLGRFDAIVIGSRAYETEPALVENNGRLLDYARQGGHLVVQYQQHAFFQGQFAPYPLTVAPRHDRVTDETAAVRLVAPNDPIFRVPNQISDADWSGWVQERGLYFARSWDRRYRPLISMNDSLSPPLEGGLLVAPVGKGTYLYTGLAFFRQLTAGVPGAFRLFANLLTPAPRTPTP